MQQRWLWLGFTVLFVAVFAVASGCSQGVVAPQEAPRERMQVDEVLGDAGEKGFARVLSPRPLEFPADHGPHPAYRNEWWYVTGNLHATEVDRHFGFELTIFRSALHPPRRRPSRTSAWAHDQVYMAHFAVTDVAGERIVAFDRLLRGTLGLAGVTQHPFRAWVGDWSLASSTTPFVPLRLRASQEGVRLDLELGPGKAPVLHGEQGYSRKGPEPGQASHYYSFTRLPARGVIEIDGDSIRVEGSAWLDREWSTAALAEGIAGWDWFALQFDDGRDVMLYRLRQSDGTAAAQSSGTVVKSDGATRHLEAADFQVIPRRHWTSPDTGVRYPIAWDVRVPGQGIEVTLEPWLDDQELDLAVRYWEGAVRVLAAGSSQSLGNGYIELTGYGSVP